MVTSAMDAAIEDAKHLSNWLWDGMGGLKIDAGLRERLAISALVVALHHHKAPILLRENGSYQSFMALLRPQMDAWVNGAWLHRCATEVELEEFASGKSHVQPKAISIDWKPTSKAVSSLRSRPGAGGRCATSPTPGFFSSSAI